MTALLADELDLIRAAGQQRLSWRDGYLIDGVVVDAATRHRINELIRGGHLYVQGAVGPGMTAQVCASDEAAALLPQS